MTFRGKTTWSKRSIETILTNEKYVGDVILYKTFSPNFPEKKRIQNNGEHKKYIQEDHHPTIISREMFRAVQVMRENRSNIEKELGTWYPYNFGGYHHKSNAALVVYTGAERGSEESTCRRSSESNDSYLLLS